MRNICLFTTEVNLVRLSILLTTLLHSLEAEPQDDLQ